MMTEAFQSKRQHGFPGIRELYFPFAQEPTEKLPLPYIYFASLVPRPRQAFSHLQYRKAGKA